MKGFKGFNKDLKCRDFQFEEGKEYEHTGKISLCNSGFHCCENPLDVLDYYDLTESVFHEVEFSGDIEKQKEGDSKLVSSKIKIGKKISIKDFINTAVDYVKNSCKNKIVSGHSSKNASSGHSSTNASSGHSSSIEMTGRFSVGVCAGNDNKIKGKIGCWITLSEWKYSEEEKCNIPICVVSKKIDGKKIKEDIWYMLKNGKFVEVKD